MAKQVKQFRYYEDGSIKNWPKDKVTYGNLLTGGLFQPYVPISQLGIQALPGTKFYLNHANNPVIIGHTGIYELDLEGLAEVTSLSFDAHSLQAISRNANAFLIVDIVYEQEETN